MESRRTEIKEVWITSAHAVSALGNSLEEGWDRIVKGTCGIKPVGRFPVEAYGGPYAAYIDDLAPRGEKSIIDDLLDHLTESIKTPCPPDVALITATTKFGIDNLERNRRGETVRIEDILPASMPKVVSRKLGLKNGGVNISASCASSTIAVAEAATAIATGMTEVVLVCCADVVTEFVFSGFSALKILSSQPCRPFDRDRAGITLGDGAAMLLLMSKDRAEKEGCPCRAVVRGWGVANDAFHITSPIQDASGLVSAISRAMKRAHLSPEDIAAISAHGTGTVFNDLMELRAFARVFGDRKVPLYSVKGSIGHTLGAAGGIEIALATQALAARMIPPTVGFENPEEGAEGIVNAEPVPFSGDYMLTTNSGFGGINAAILLERGRVS